MLRKYLWLISFSLCTSYIIGQKVDLTYYLPDIKYDDKITTPEEYLGYMPGEWHISHDKLVSYLQLISQQSDRVELEVTGYTHERRPLMVLHISTPDNLKHKEKIRAKHLELTEVDKSQAVDIADLPVVLYQGYSIHGNESSGANAVPLVVYYLAAGQEGEVLKVLENSYILLDPCYNPDGLTRFSTWVNSHKGKNLITDPETREYNEMWPGGRTNHYWFDLNRDWLLLTHPESESRMKTFHKWKPNVLTDHHEMGKNSTFFFQPGVPSRTNPNTPQRNQELTELIGEFHAAALDEIGSLYFTKQQYDDFYYGKGSTYPDIHGSIGILFEQASSRGHLQETENGLLAFPFTIRNQVVTSLSTQRAALKLREELLNFKREFYNIKAKEATQNPIKGYLYTDHDKDKLERFNHILTQHDIEFFIDEKTGKYFIPTEQKQYGLIKSMFEKVTSFKDSIFYDVSSWTLPLAFDLEYESVSQRDLSRIVPKNEMDTKPSVQIREDDIYAFTIDWSQHEAPRLVNRLLSRGIISKVVTKELKIDEALPPGTVIVAASQLSTDDPLREEMISYAKEGRLVDVLYSGYGEGGETAGSPVVRTIDQPVIFTLVGSGVSAYDAGEVWHHFDHNLDMPITLLDIKDLRYAELDRYNTLILPNGSYSSIDSRGREKIKKWIDRGGHVVSMRGGSNLLERMEVISREEKTKPKADVHAMRQYTAARNRRGAQVLGGAIFKGEMDLTHPLCFGYRDSEIALFRRGTNFNEVTVNPYATPVTYAQDPLHSGYIPLGIDKVASEAAAATLHRYGGGSVVSFADNLLFRGYWWGTHKLLANAIFFDDLIDRSTMQSRPVE